jgi:hypothetical protein
MTDTLADRATLADLSRKMGIVETLLLGAAHQLPHPTHLTTLYFDACRQEAFDDEVTARHWERQIYVLDARALLLMARRLRDPTPWHPFLVLLDRFIENGIDLETCRQHLLSIAQDLLNLQGLRKIAPRDVAGNPLRIKTVLAAISRRGGLHGSAQKAGT